MSFNNINCIFIFQRGTDELLSQSGGAVSNGSAMSPESHDNENNNDAKKVSGPILFLIELERD